MKKVVIILMILALFLFAGNSIAQEKTLPKVRAFYDNNGQVYITYFIAKACFLYEEDIDCMNRISALGKYANLPFDDLSPDQLPSDRLERDKWRGKKGQGIWIDKSLVTKVEKMEELTIALEKELKLKNPNPVSVIKLQRNIEKLKSLSPDIKVLSPEFLSEFGITEITQPRKGILRKIWDWLLAFSK